ncbi:MAG: hypothetical protein K9N47_11770 [Prosthecobacter sp.]|uniref:hypothetical protein n=1 Tax=Prosthecobacter sp. TaxID=1965333 RepID=UPI0025EEE313|nr:hypothetical protein [Prosthecobacter sp.]MCF7786793.1 hypothetical protein [Prosthecobacter sp.]
MSHPVYYKSNHSIAVIPTQRPQSPPTTTSTTGQPTGSSINSAIEGGCLTASSQGC